MIEKAEAARGTLDRIEADLADLPDLDIIRTQFDALRRQLEEFSVSCEKQLARDQTFDTIQGLTSDLRFICEPMDRWSRVLTARAQILESEGLELTALGKVWLVTLQSVVDDGAPPNVVAAVREVCDRATALTSKQEERMRDLLALQGRVADVTTTYDQTIDRLISAGQHAARRMLQRDSVPLWDSRAYTLQGADEEVRKSFSSRGTHVLRYISLNQRAITTHAVVTLVLFLLLSLVKRKLSRAADIDDPQLLTVVQRPLSAAYALSIVGLSALYPPAPRIFTFSLVISGMLACLRVIGPLVITPLRVCAYALIALAAVDASRAFLLSAITVFRLFVACEQTGLVVFLAWLLRSGRLQAAREESPTGVTLVTLGAYWGLVGGSLALVANVSGHLNLSRYLLNFTVGPLYLVLVLATSLRILDALLLFALRTWPLANLAAVSRNEGGIRTLLRKSTIVLGTLVWLRFLISQTPIDGIIMAYLRGLMDVTTGIGGVTLGGVLSFVAVVLASLVLSRILLSLLEEDVYPRCSLPSGVPFAISTMSHYLLVLLGFLVALNTLGIDMNRFTLLVSAFGVGLGFGLQTIVNNLVSGIILLFERPVKIGDVIEMANQRGVLTHIGLRASVLHASDGSDIILPNGTLLSANVVNYTLADQRRRLEIEVLIPSGYDADAVMSMLAEEARKVEHVLHEPAPECLFVKFTDKQVTLQVRAWVESAENWRRVRSCLNTAIYGTLLREGMVASLPLVTDK